jgi:hypothetical protein
VGVLRRRLLIMVVSSFGAGETYEFRTEQRLHFSASVENDASGVAFDPCTMVDSGMLPWMRWSIVSGVVMLCVSAWAFGRGRKRAME